MIALELLFLQFFIKIVTQTFGMMCMSTLMEPQWLDDFIKSLTEAFIRCIHHLLFMFGILDLLIEIDQADTTLFVPVQSTLTNTFDLVFIRS